MTPTGANPRSDIKLTDNISGIRIVAEDERPDSRLVAVVPAQRADVQCRKQAGEREVAAGHHLPEAVERAGPRLAPL